MKMYIQNFYHDSAKIQFSLCTHHYTLIARKWEFMNKNFKVLIFIRGLVCSLCVFFFCLFVFSTFNFILIAMQFYLVMVVVL